MPISWGSDPLQPRLHSGRAFGAEDHRFAKSKFRLCGVVLVVVLVLENPDRFAIKLTRQISGRKSVFFQCTEDEHDDEDDFKIENLG